MQNRNEKQPVKRGFDAREQSESYAIFKKTLQKMARHPALQILREIPQHKGHTTFSHCVCVAWEAYKLSQKLHLSIDIEAMVRGAMLHDFYLYDTETMPYTDYQHSMIHPKLALKNAEKYFDLTDKERNIILSHMWPIPGTPLPRSKEAMLVSSADKLCACREIYHLPGARKPQVKSKS